MQSSPAYPTCSLASSNAQMITYTLAFHDAVACRTSAGYSGMEGTDASNAIWQSDEVCAAGAWVTNITMKTGRVLRKRCFLILTY